MTINFGTIYDQAHTRDSVSSPHNWVTVFLSCCVFVAVFIRQVMSCRQIQVAYVSHIVSSQTWKQNIHGMKRFQTSVSGVKSLQGSNFSIEKELLVYELSHRTKGQAFSCSNFKRSHCQHCGRVTGCVFHCTGPPIARSAYKSYGLGLGVGSLLRQCAHRYIQQLYRGLLIGRARLLYGSSGAMKFVDLKITNLFAAQ